MAHTALYGGTVYEKKGGADLVGGTVYKKDHGKVLVGGTAYEVGFGHPVLLAGGGQGTGAGYTLTVDDASYGFTNAWSHETVSTASVTITSSTAMNKIILNGETVVSGAGEYTVDLSDATHVVFNRLMLNMMITTYNIDTVKDVTVTVTGVGYSGLAQIEYNGVVYTSATKFTAKTGDIIHVIAKNTVSGNSDYYYLVTSDAVFNMNYQTSGSSGANGSVGITTIPEGHALVQITGSGGSYAYGLVGVTIDGTQYTTTQTIVVTVGTVITCSVVTMAAGEEDGYVKVNGTNVLSVSTGQGTYDYTVTGNVTIDMSTVRDSDKMRTGYITITEQ